MPINPDIVVHFANKTNRTLDQSNKTLNNLITQAQSTTDGWRKNRSEWRDKKSGVVLTFDGDVLVSVVVKKPKPIKE
jgi:hypothetical protein